MNNKYYIETAAASSWAGSKKNVRSMVGLVMQVSGSLIEVDILELSESP